jgi:multidrug resistance efflux pump
MRTFVILGIVLIIVSIGIAKLALDHQSPAAPANGKNSSDAGSTPERIACWGYFEVEGGVAQLDAKQSGDVTKVEKENVPVKKGDLLLQVNDKFAQLKVAQAKIALNVAELQLKEAEDLTELYKLQKEQQQAAINGVNSKIKLEKLKEETALKTVGMEDPKYKSIQEQYEQIFVQLNESLKAENAKLKQLALQNAELKIQQAEADRDAKKAQLDEATESLTLYKITAPSNGTILRANYRVGEILAPNPMKHAIEFLPDAPIIVKAEVLQEWGRYVVKGQPVDIEDDTYHGPTWKGKVHSISKWYAPTRSPVIEPFRYNDVRTLEVLISVTGAENSKIGQRVRAMIQIK